MSKYLPFFTPKAPDGTIPAILIRHLLTHSSGLTYGSIPDDVTGGSDTKPVIPLEENLRRLAKAPLQFAPGTKWEYGTSIDVLGGVVGAIEGDISNVDAAVIKHVSGPLGMTDTRFGVTDVSRLAHPYGDGTPEPIRMSDPQRMAGADGNVSIMSPGRIFKPGYTQCGGSAMAGTAGDFMKLLQAVRGDFLSATLREQAFRGHIVMDRPGSEFTLLGARIVDPKEAGWPKADLIQWGGIWGNNWIIDLATETVLVVYTNTMWSGCNGRFRDEMRDAVFG